MYNGDTERGFLKFNYTIYIYETINQCVSSIIGTRCSRQQPPSVSLELSPISSTLKNNNQ